MPAVQGGVDEETYSKFVENLVENAAFEDESEAVEYCVRYTLRTKYNVEL